MTHDLFRLESEVRELHRWYAKDAERLAFLEDRVAQLLAKAGETVTRLPLLPGLPSPATITVDDLQEARDQERHRCATELRAYAERQGSSPPLRSPKGLAMELADMIESDDS